MFQQPDTSKKAPLSPDDLEVLDKFLEAWCEENGVDRTDSAAQDVASSLIAWYQEDQKYRSRVQLKSPDEMPIAPDILALLKQIS